MAVRLSPTQLVDHVTLNGERIAGVFELDDTEGWLRRYVYGVVDTTAIGDSYVRHRIQVAGTERLTGTVRVHWKPAV